MESKEIKSIYDFTNYKEYLKEVIPRLEKKGRGFRSRLARELRCQTAYISQVFNGSAHFSSEQGLQVNHLLGHSEEESKMFLLLIQLGRAGTFELKEFYRRQIEDLRAQRLLLRERFKTRGQLGKEEQMLFYSEWYYSALHILSSIPAFQTTESMSKVLNLPVTTTNRALEFLVDCGLVIKESGLFKVGTTRIHLGSDSPMISKHHTNWRLQAMQTLARRSDQDLHYTSVISVSKSDALKLRELWVTQLERYNTIVAKSPEEECHCLTLDFFTV